MEAGSTDSPDNRPQVLDASALDTLAEQLGEDIDGLVERFAKRLADTGPAIEASLTAEDWVELSRHAHSLKSVAATFGAAAVSRSSAALEACAGSGDGAELTAAVDRLAADCQAAQGAVDAWLSSRGA